MASKYLIIYLGLLASNYSYAQRQPGNLQHMNMDERIAYLQGSVTHYDSQPVYRLHIEIKNAYKVMINGFPVGNNFGDIATNLNVVVNHALLESGNQRVEVQVYPPYREGDAAQTLSDEATFSLRIIRVDLTSEGQPTPETVYEFNLKDHEPDGDEPVFVFEDQFKADIPYRLKGWSEAEPFNVSDSLAIKAKLYAGYKEMIEAYEKKDIDFIWNAYLNADAEWYQAEYLDAAAIENFQRNYMRRGKTYTYGRATEAIDGVRFFPLGDFNLVFYCDNKIACLEFASGKFKGESKFAYQTVGSLGRNEVQFFDLYYMQNPDPEDNELIIVR